MNSDFFLSSEREGRVFRPTTEQLKAIRIAGAKATFVARTKAKEERQPEAEAAPSPTMSAVRGRIPDRRIEQAALMTGAGGARQPEQQSRTPSPDPLDLDVLAEDEDGSLPDAETCGHCNGTPGGSRHCDYWTGKDEALTRRREREKEEAEARNAETAPPPTFDPSQVTKEALLIAARMTNRPRSSSLPNTRPKRKVGERKQTPAI